jgi:hypothetical protein
MRLLPACGAVNTTQLRSAVEAILLVSMSVGARFAGRRLDSPGEQAAGHSVADCV